MRPLKKRGGLTRGHGMTEVVRLLWIYSSHKCAEIHQAMTDVLNSQHGTSDQHIDLRTSQKERDHDDLVKPLHCLTLRSPFIPIEPNLRCLDS